MSMNMFGLCGRTALVGVLFAGGLAACAANTFSSAPGTDGGGADAVEDAGRHPDANGDVSRRDAKPADAGHDAPKRDGSPRDSGARDSGEATTADDSGSDGPVDVARDARHDTGADAPHDAGADRLVDGGSDVVDAGSDIRDVGVDSFVCDLAASPHDQPCVIDESLGVFVAPPANGGSDTMGDGSRAKPFGSIIYAVAQVTSVDGGVAVGKRVYACGGTFPGTVAIDQSVAIYGGLACPNAADGGGASDAAADADSPAWSYTGQLATVSGDPSLGAAASFLGVPGAHVEDMGFEEGTSPTGSSLGIYVAASHGVTLTRVLIRAGNGSSALPQPGPESNWCPTETQGGSDARSGAGGNGGSCTCALVTGDKSNGGRGASAGGAGKEGTSSPSDSDAGVGGDGGVLSCYGGRPGGPGRGGQAGAAAPLGSFVGARWTALQAGSGTPGDPGEGGGGAGGSTQPSAGGGGGGAGGCGGSGGAGGMPGGVSFGVLVNGSSTVSLSSLTVLTGTGGNGGGGADGEDGQPGASGGLGDILCNGGHGGTGGGGGGGGGGAGGDSVGIVIDSTSSVTVDGTNLRSRATLDLPSLFIGGSPGLGGAGGGPGQAVNGQSGQPGQHGPGGLAAAVASL